MYTTLRYTLVYTGMYTTLRYTLVYMPLCHPEVHPGIYTSLYASLFMFVGGIPPYMPLSSHFTVGQYSPRTSQSLSFYTFRER